MKTLFSDLGWDVFRQVSKLNMSYLPQFGHW